MDKAPTFSEQVRCWHGLATWLARRERSVLLVDASGSLAELVLHKAGVRYERFASRSLTETFGVWIEPWLRPTSLAERLPGPAVQPAFLGRQSMRMEYVFPLGAGLASARDPVSVVVETLDSALSGLRDLGLVELNDAETLRGLLAGGWQARFRQWVWVCNIGWLDPSDRRKFLEMFSRAGFGFYDLSCTPFSSELDGTPDWIVALPPDVDLDFDQTLVEDVSLEIPMEQVIGDNIYSLEIEGANRWRWSGPRPDLKILLPCVRGSLVEIIVYSLADEEAACQARLYWDGRLLDDVRLPDSVPGVLELPMPPNVNLSGWSILQLSLPWTNRPNPEDPRWLGVALAGVRLRETLAR